MEESINYFNDLQKYWDSQNIIKSFEKYSVNDLHNILMDLYAKHPNRKTTYTGKSIDIANITEDDIDIRDIAHSLSLQARWAGHNKFHYSVARHCIWACEHAPEEYKLDLLLHDATETYLVDLPRPVKNLIPEYKVLEDKLHQIICNKFNIEFPYRPMVHLIDNLSIAYEWENCVQNKNIEFIEPVCIEYTFLRMYNKYKRN